MAAPSHAEVAEMIRAAVQLSVEDVNNRFGHILQTQVSQAAAEEALGLVIAEATQKFDSDRERVDGVIAGANEEFQRQRSTLQNIVAEFQGSSKMLDQTVRQAQARDGQHDGPACQVARGSGHRVRQPYGVDQQEP